MLTRPQDEGSMMGTMVLNNMLRYVGAALRCVGMFQGLRGSVQDLGLVQSC